MLFEDIIQYNPGYSLGAALEYAFQEYEEDFFAYWGLDSHEPPEWFADSEDEWRQLIALHQLAAKLAGGAAELVRPQRLPEAKLSLPTRLDEEAHDYQHSVDRVLERFSGELSPDEMERLRRFLQPGALDDPRVQRSFVQNCFELEAAIRYPADPTAYAERLRLLATQMLRSPGELTRAYLRRVAECFVRDMPMELAVMARAVLDAALQEVLSDEAVVAVAGLRAQRGSVNLERRIEAATAEGIFDDGVRQAADRVRAQGNSAAHFLPDFNPSTADLLADLSACLRAIELAKR